MTCSPSVVFYLLQNLQIWFRQKFCAQAAHFDRRDQQQQALSALEVYPFVVFMSKGFSDKKLRVGFHVGGEARLFSVEMLNIEKGGTLWRITGTTYSIG
ncbi:hypothetical protein TELCIR_11899 [Teladorsagia circumcincta]|uniref:Uncharacterized protein n=1 Tax=Teladorsagia circumcincta TaxID=45464 RepID=A0A2G9UA77_TELCI|nr:hypothetical protein TELCIR_11899 [Teladorsagia circumcincta]